MFNVSVHRLDPLCGSFLYLLCIQYPSGLRYTVMTTEPSTLAGQ